MHLRDRGAGDRRAVERLEHLRRPACRRARSSVAITCSDGERRHAVLQLRELVGDVGRQQVAPRGEHLPELDEDRAQVLEREAQPLRARRRRVAPERERARERPHGAEPLVAGQELVEPVLERDERDPREAEEAHAADCKGSRRPLRAIIAHGAHPRLPHHGPPESIDALGHVNNQEYVRWMQEVAIAHSEAQGWPLERYTRARARQGALNKSHAIALHGPMRMNAQLPMRRDEGRSRATKPRSAARQAPHWAAARRDGALRAVCFVRFGLRSDPPFAAPRFAQPIPNSRRRNRAGLVQRLCWCAATPSNTCARRSPATRSRSSHASRRSRARARRGATCSTARRIAPSSPAPRRCGCSSLSARASPVRIPAELRAAFEVVADDDEALRFVRGAPPL